MSHTRKTAPTPSGDALGYTVNRVGAMCEVSSGKLYGEIASGNLKARKLGTRTIILHADLMDWLESLPVKQGRSDLHRARVQQRYQQTLST